MKLHIIGTGCPSPNPNQYGSAFALEVGAELVLVDCGPATTYKMTLMHLCPKRVQSLLLTHLHFDHNCDVPCFALSRWDMTIAGEPLNIYGPPPTEQFVDRLFGPTGAFVEDWQSRVAHPASHACHTARGGSLPRPAPNIVARDVDTGAVIEGAAWRASVQRVHHVEPGLLSVAYRIETDEGSIVFAGDCGDCQELRDFSADADNLVVACTHFGAGSMNPDLTDVIIGTTEAAGIGVEAGVKRLILTHTSPGYESPGRKEKSIAQIAQTYHGEIAFPAELKTVQL